VVLSAAAPSPGPHPLTSGRPKDAATLLIVRTDNGEARVLMGRRHRGHAYMPDKWVFPGGRIDRADFTVPAATELRPEVAALLERTAAPRRARALACAAIRETFEETGLLLGLPAEPVKRPGVWGSFLAAGARPDLAALDFVARAITPPARTRRFDARFFMADAAALVSLEPGAGSGELDELAWFDWTAAAALDLPRITRGILAEAAAWRADRTRPILHHRVVNRRYRSDPL
jgi:8-oxo-dGTP pyrophosphatase MutT (NUDIX family)